MAHATIGLVILVIDGIQIQLKLAVDEEVRVVDTERVCHLIEIHLNIPAIGALRNLVDCLLDIDCHFDCLY
jgi:hypothetical protein